MYSDSTLFFAGYAIGVMVTAVCCFFLCSRERERISELETLLYREKHRGMPAAQEEEEEWPDVIEI
jgi:hypothetical protein